MRLTAKNDSINSESFYAAIFDSIGSPILIIDPQTAAILDANEAACKFYGYPHSDFIQKKILELAAIPTEEAWQRIRKIAAGEITHMTLQHHLANGEIRDVEVDLGRGKFEDRAVNIATVHDITERKQAKKKLQEGEDRYHSLFENMREGFALQEIIQDEAGRVVDFRFLDANAAYEEHTGQKLKEIIGHTIRETMPNADQAMIERYGNVALTGEPLDFEYYSKTFNRHIRVRSFRPQPNQFASIFEDITERKNAELLLQTVNTELEKRVQERTAELGRIVERLNLATDAAKMGIWDWDIQHNVLIWDKQMYSLYGVKPEDFGGAYEAWLNGIHPDDRETSEQVSEQARRGEIPYDVEFRVLWPDGSTHWLKADGQVFWDEQGNPIRMLGVNYDITERKQAQNTLNESHFRTKMAIHGADAGTWEWNVQTGETIFNERWAQIVGYTLKELEPINIQTWIALCHPDDLKLSDEILEKHFTGQTESYECEVRMKHKDGSWVWVFDSGKVMEWTKEGKPLRMFGTHLNITERKRLELELSESEQKYTTLFEKSSVPSLLYRLPDIIIENVNEAFEEISGYQRQELLGKNVTDIRMAPPAEYAQTVADFNEQGFISKREARLFTKSGAERTILLNINSVSLHNEPHAITTFTDITERKRAENALRESEERFSQAFHTGTVINSMIHADTGRFIDVNDYFLNLFEYRREQVIGHTYQELDLVADPAQTAEMLRQAHEQGYIHNYEVVLRTSSGKPVTLLTSMKHFHIAGVLYSISTSIDITERKQAELKLAETNTALGKALRTKDEFMAAMSHELRTPLAGIMGMAEMLQSTAADSLNSKQVGYLATIQQSSNKLLELINNLLEFTHLQSSTAALNLLSCSIAGVCQTALQQIIPVSNSKQQQTHYTSMPSEIILQTDEKRLVKVLLLLLDNASKFTPRGGELGIEVIGRSEAELVEFTVWDTGIGISEENLTRLFKPFAQLDTSLARQYEGAGLGLALAKGLTDLLDGTISVQSTLGKGSRFTVTLPWKYPSL